MYSNVRKNIKKFARVSSETRGQLETVADQMLREALANPPSILDEMQSVPAIHAVSSVAEALDARDSYRRDLYEEVKAANDEYYSGKCTLHKILPDVRLKRKVCRLTRSL